MGKKSRLPQPTTSARAAAPLPRTTSHPLSTSRPLTTAAKAGIPSAAPTPLKTSSGTATPAIKRTTRPLANAGEPISVSQSSPNELSNITLSRPEQGEPLLLTIKTDGPSLPITEVSDPAVPAATVGTLVLTRMAPARVKPSAKGHVADDQKRWSVAILQAIPLALGLYDIFLLIVHWNGVAAALLGALAVLAMPLLQMGRVWQRLAAWLGDPRMMGRSGLALGLALVFWAAWNASGNPFFSLLSVLSLMSAIIFVILAQRERPTEPSVA